MSKKEVKLEIVYLPVDALEEYEGNARDHGEEDVKAIQRSIEKFGFDDPIGIWSDHNVIVEGHGRLMAAKALGMKEVPCIRLDHMTDAERKAYGLAHNKTAELSRWNFGKLELELSNLGEFNMGDFGFGFSNGSSDFGVVSNPEDQYGAGDEGFRDYQEPLSKEELEAYSDNADDFLLKRRVIITFLPEQEEELKALLGIKDENMRVVYSLEDLTGEKE
jgi:hypothetical protein